MNATDQKIAEVLSKFGEPLAGNVWRVQGTPVIYHKALERIAAQAKIRFDTPTVLRAERDEAVLLVHGYLHDRMEWSIGEALVAVNYRVSGKQAAYVWAMAEKRAKDRVILKLIELHGLVYSEEEADEFKKKDEDDRSSSQRMADELIAEVNACRTAARVRKLEVHPEFVKMKEACDPDDQARVDLVISRRAADLLREQAA